MTEPVVTQERDAGRRADRQLALNQIAAAAPGACRNRNDVDLSRL